MKKSYLMLAAAAALFAACSNDDGVAEAQKAEQQVAAGEVPVGFDVYVSRGTTRAGATGDLTTDGTGSTTSLQTTGFGVFAYHTNSDAYDQTFTPNFMYNQQVTYNSTATAHWEYSPIKYWPNEFGATAASEDVDKVSFFAYAPYVAVTATTGKVTADADWGIVGMKSNSAAGDPMVKYMASFYTDKQVDLVWGTIKTTGTWDQKNGGTMGITAGMPWLDIQHPNTTSSTDRATAQKVDFDFKHALARLNVTVDTKANNTSAASPLTEVGGGTSATKVFIRSVTFEGFDMKGALNLNNTTASTAQWYNFDCLSELNNGNEVTIKDGRTDGKEGVTAATKEFAAINKNFVQDGTWAAMNTAATARPGVTGTAANLFCPFGGGVPASDAPIYVIPNGDPLKVTIEYDVLTADDNLNGKLNDGTTPGSVVKNVITRYITLESTGGSVTPTGAITLANGLKYTIALHLGLNSVEFNASVTDWPTATADGADLPHNNN